MKSDMKKFLRRMISDNGFIAKGVYSTNHHYWHHNNKTSMGIMDVTLFHKLHTEGYIRKDRTGKYYPTDAGRRFAMPWYKRVFDIL